MPDFFFSQALTANEQDNRPIENWSYRRLPYRALVTVLMRATGASVRQTISTGTTTIVQKSPVTAGGTAGQIPVPQDTPVTQWVGSPGDEVIISLDEVSGATPTVDGHINVEPMA